MTKVEAILQALQATIINALPLVLVERSRTSSFGESELPAINIKPAIDDSINHAQSFNRHEFNVTFEIHVKPQPIPDSSADVIVKAQHEAILNSTTLLNLVAHVEYKSRQWQFGDGDGDALQLNVQYLFTYINLANEL